MSKLFSHIKHIKKLETAQSAVDEITLIYEKNTEAIRSAFEDFISGHCKIDAISKQHSYPFVGVEVPARKIKTAYATSYGAIIKPGIYGTTLTRPDIFSDYFLDQLSLLKENHGITFYVGESDETIPFPFVSNRMDIGVSLEEKWQMQLDFAMPNLSAIHDDIVNSKAKYAPGEMMPLALFSGLRTDYSLHRLYHYTGTPSKHFQSFILLTNYQRYIDEFKAYALDELKNDKSIYHEFVGPGEIKITKDSLAQEEPQRNLPQMPAYHLKTKSGDGVSIINIGVGPSNAKTITDHLAVLRPHCWIMLGHCAGLRHSLELGDYVLAHAYVRDDNVLNHDLPHYVPIPALAEVQIALQDAVAEVTQQDREQLLYHLRTGTVATTDNRNWELRYHEAAEKLLISRAIAVDMESGTIAANGFRHRIPYGTLLCVSDKPIHGEVKLRGMAKDFYDQRISQHLKIGIEAISSLRKLDVKNLHSRKLRGFEEPPFR